MSDYERRYNVHANYVSHYTDDPAEALRLYQSGLGHEPPPFITEGYADYEDVPGGPGQIEGTIVTRRTTGKVLPSTLELLVAQREASEVLDTVSRDAP